MIVGHDWGGMVAWNTALMARDSVERVIGINTPFIPRAPIKPTDAMRAMAAGGFHYILYFQTPGVAEAELERDVARSLRGFYQDPPEAIRMRFVKSVPGCSGRRAEDCSIDSRIARMESFSPTRTSRSS